MTRAGRVPRFLVGSVGYKVSQWEKIQGKGDAVPIMRAVRWEPYELSLVPLPADSAARVRAASSEVFECEIIDPTEESDMPRTAAPEAASEAAVTNAPDSVVTEPVVTEARTAEPALDSRAAGVPVIDNALTDAAITAARTAETARCSGITLAARKLGHPHTVADKMIADGVPLDAARAQMIDMLAAAQETT